jgi:hypothetical protein
MVYVVEKILSKNFFQHVYADEIRAKNDVETRVAFRSLSAAKLRNILQTNSFPLEKLTKRHEKGWGHRAREIRIV